LQATRAEIQLEQVRLRAQISAQGRTATVNRMAAARLELAAATTALARVEAQHAAAMAGVATAESAAAASAARLAAAQSAVTISARAAAAATGALALAVKGLSAVMAFLGGPVGVIITAAAAMWIFRDSLYAIISPADAAKKKIDELRESMEKKASTDPLTDELKSSVNELDESLVKLIERYQRFQSLVRLGGVVALTAAKYTEDQIQQIITLRTEYAKEIAVRERAAKVAQDAIRLAQGFTAATDDVADSQETASKKIKETIDALRKKIIELTKGERELFKFENANDATALALYDQVKALEADKDATEAAKKAKEQYRKELQSLTDRIYPQAAAVRKLMEEYLLLNQAIINGDFSQKAVHDWLDAEVAIKSAHRAVKELAAQADPFAEIWKNTTQRVQGWFADAFYDILDKGKITFDGLLDMFKRMAAEMMAQRIMISIGGMMGSGSAMAGILGGGGGGAGMFGNLWSGVSGLATGQGLSGFSGMFSGFGSAMNSAGMVINNAMNQMGGAFATLSWGIESAGYSIAEMFGMQQVGAGQATMLGGLATAGAGWAGGYVGAGLGRSLTGKDGSGWGATGGAAIGAYVGSIVPVLGTMLGAAIGGLIGGVVDSIFGSSAWNTTRGGIQLGFGDEGFDPVQWERQTKKGGAFSSTKRRYRFSELDPETEQAFQDVYAATIDQVAGLYDILGINIAEGALEAVRIAELKIGTSGKSKQTEEEIQEQIEQWFNSLTDAMVAAILPDMTKEQLQAIATALAPLRALLSVDAAGGARADYALSSSPDRATRVYTQSADALRTMIGEYDGSVESINSLTEAMAMQQQLTYELTTAYLQVSDAVSILFGNLSENIRMSLMGAEELYEYQRQQVHTLSDALATMTDPEQILATTQQIERLVSQLWSGLDDDQRQELGEGYLEFLDRAESLAQTRLSEGMKTVEQTQADLVSGMREQLALAASEMMQAALEQRQAAQMNLMAAEQMGMYLGQYGMNYAPEVNG